MATIRWTDAALWSTDVLRPPKFDAGPPSIGARRLRDNWLARMRKLATRALARRNISLGARSDESLLSLFRSRGYSRNNIPRRDYSISNESLPPLRARCANTRRRNERAICFRGDSTAISFVHGLESTNNHNLRDAPGYGVRRLRRPGNWLEIKRGRANCRVIRDGCD